MTQKSASRAEGAHLDFTPTLKIPIADDGQSDDATAGSWCAHD